MIGTYKYLIHPSYSTAVLALIGYFMFFTNSYTMPHLIRAIHLEKWESELMIFYWLQCIGGGIAFFWVMGTRVKTEEAMLANHFKSEWENYVKKRKRYIPWII